MAFASTVQFAPDETTGFDRVGSRLLLAGESGRGEVAVGGRRVPLLPATILVLPWAHRVRYRPDPDDPFLVHGVHLIPWHAVDRPVELAVPHHRTHPLTDSPDRRDIHLPIGDALWRGDAQIHPVLRSIIVLAARLWDRDTPSLPVARALGDLLLNELRTVTVAAPQVRDDPALPVRLRRMMAWVHAEPGRPVTLDALAGVAGVSAASVTRLFRQHLHTSPLVWVLDVRLDLAASLLMTTNLPISRVAHLAGFADAGYFSRRFRAVMGVSPSEWRRRRSA